MMSVTISAKLRVRRKKISTYKLLNILSLFVIMNPDHHIRKLEKEFQQ